MSINFDEKNKIFYINAGNSSYIINIYKSGYLAHVYWGKHINSINCENMLRAESVAFSANNDLSDKSYSLDVLRQEYPQYGNSDFRHPAYQILLENGTTVTDLKYKSHKIYKGKPVLEGLPSTYVENDDEADTLDIELTDSVTGLTVILSYTAFNNLNVIARSAKFINNGNKNLTILTALSACVDFDNDNFDFLHLYGAWGRERYINRTNLNIGTQSIESRRGASSHQHNPFIALVSKNADENCGEVYAMNLVYSGNFAATVEVDQLRQTRMSIGIDPFNFSWLLTPGESFTTPEAVMVYSSEGLGEMSRTFHKLYRTRLCRGQYRDRERPILINNWEATYFNFNENKILEIAKTAKDLGIELFVLDDGWFGKRDSDNCSLGDWYVDKNKLPNGLTSLVNEINKIGLKFGLWFEPEMVSPDSDLYRTHPDWCLHVPDRTRSESRNQLILDLSRKEVCDYIIKMISDILNGSNITYVKWDMNRHMTEVGSDALPPERQKETAHRYILGLYYMMDTLTKNFPNVLFEGCSGGGGRYDPGILYYMPQFWTSDDTDAVERIKIQYGTTLVYPPSTMSCHVSAVPNHQVGRITSLKMRGDVAMSGNFGYELDVTKFSDKEKDIVKKQIDEYKSLRKLIQFGDFYRLKNPFEGNDAAWIFVSDDKCEAFGAYFRILAKPNAPRERLRFAGLDPNKNYIDIENGKVYSGSELMYVGLFVPYMHGDFVSHVWKFKAL